MGVQDRDWHREWWVKHQSKADGEVVSAGTNVQPPKSPLCQRPPVRELGRWHPVLTVLATFFICSGVYLLLRFVASFRL